MSILPVEQRSRVLAALDPETLIRFAYDWMIWARDDQLPPLALADGQPWRTWLILGGRGSGKTRAGAEWIRARALGTPGLADAPARRIALVGRTIGQVRDIMIEGVSGLMSVHAPHERPLYEVSRNQLTWPNGAIAQMFAADDYENLRGPQFDTAWCDELAKWRAAERAWDTLQFTMRLGDCPQVCVTTTPRATRFLKKLIGDPQLVVSRARTADNAANLAPAFIADMVRRYGGTPMGRQELDGEVVDERMHGLWRRAWIEQNRIAASATDAFLGPISSISGSGTGTRVPTGAGSTSDTSALGERQTTLRQESLSRIVVAVDPPVTATAGSDSCGIVVAGLMVDGRAIILADRTIQGRTPDTWARAAVQAYHDFQADRLVAEVNQGGDLVVAVIQQVDPTVPVHKVRATRGKWLRAEPVAQLYAEGRVAHLGTFPELERQMCDFGADGLSEGRSPDRLDALVWALTDLMLTRQRNPDRAPTVGWIKWPLRPRDPTSPHRTCRLRGLRPRALAKGLALWKPLCLRAVMPTLNLLPRGFIAGVADRISRAALAAAARGGNALTRKSAPRPDSRKNAPAFPVSPWFSYDAVSGANWAPRDYTAFAREGYMQNAIVYRCVRMIAEAAASIPFCLYDGPHEVEDHPLLRLIAAPTSTTTRAELFEAYYGFLLVSGNAYLEAVSLGDQLRELHILRPDRMVVVPGADGYPEAYDYSVEGSKPVRLDGDAVPGVRRVLHHKLFHPLNDHYGLSPIEAAATAIDIHNAASRWNKALLDNSARPSGALVYASRDGNLTTEQYNRLKQELESQFQGAGNAGRPLLLEGGLDWKSMSMSPKDLDFMEAKHGAAREIALALGVPPMLLGIPGDNTFSNYQEANRTFWRQTVLPLVQRTTAALSEWLTPAYGPNLTLAADLDDIPALSGEVDALWTRLNAADFLTTEEKRAAAGYGSPASTDGLVSRSRGTNKDFNPEQPRDDQGRWTSEGEGGGDGSDSAGGGGDPHGGTAGDGGANDPSSSDATPSSDAPPNPEDWRRQRKAAASEWVHGFNVLP